MIMSHQLNHHNLLMFQAAMVILEMSWLRRPEDRSGRRFSAPSTCGLKASGNETGNISSSSGDRAGALGTIEIGHQERKPAAVSIDVGSFRDTKHVMAKLLPIRVTWRHMETCFFCCCLQVYCTPMYFRVLLWYHFVKTCGIFPWNISPLPWLNLTPSGRDAFVRRRGLTVCIFRPEGCWHWMCSSDFRPFRSLTKVERDGWDLHLLDVQSDSYDYYGLWGGTRLSCDELYPDTSRTLGWSRKILCWKPIGLGFPTSPAIFVVLDPKTADAQRCATVPYGAGLCKFILSCHSTCFFYRAPV
jgi:hypothetical protein